MVPADTDKTMEKKMSPALGQQGAAVDTGESREESHPTTQLDLFLVTHSPRE